MKNFQPQWMIEQSKQDTYHFLAWRKLADCYGMLFDESILESFVGLSSEEILDAMLASTNVFLSEAEKSRAIVEQQNYFSDYCGIN